MRVRLIHPRRHGFTLMEVMATLLVLGIVLPVAMRAVSTCTNVASNAKRRAEAGGLAESKLAELIATGTWQNGKLEGDFGLDWPDYRWRADNQTWSPTQAVDNGAGNVITELDVHVTWIGRTGEQTLTLGTLVYASGGTP
jgi:prepilin-type N-terminal cleavage/methylation domain-containing protein